MILSLSARNHVERLHKHRQKNYFAMFPVEKLCDFETKKHSLEPGTIIKALVGLFALGCVLYALHMLEMHSSLQGSWKIIYLCETLHKLEFISSFLPSNFVFFTN